MKELTVPVNRAGRIVLPKDIRDELAIKPGDTLTLSLHGASVTLTPNNEATGFIRKGKALVFSTIGDKTLGGEAVSRILEKIREDRHDQSLAGSDERKRRP